MKTDYNKVVNHYTSEFFIDVDTAIKLMIENLTEHGHILPFSNPAEYWEFEKKATQQEIAENETAANVSAFIKSLRYNKGTIRHKRELFRVNIFSLTTEHGETEQTAFERMNRITPGVFDSLQDFQQYVTSLRGYIPEMNPKGARRF